MAGYAMMHKAWQSGREEVPYCFFLDHLSISRSHGTKNCWFWAKLGISRLLCKFEFTDGCEMLLKSWSSIEEVPYCFSRSSIKFQGYTGPKIADLDPNWAFLDCNLTLNSPMFVKWSTQLWNSIEKVHCCFSSSSVKFQGHTGQNNCWFSPESSVSGL